MTMDGNAVRSVDRAAALLLALGESAGEAGVTELARRLGLHKSTASRLLATLQKRGLVEQDDETGKYRLGLVVIRLAERAERTLDLRGIAMPELERLARLTHETTGLGTVNGDSLLTVAQADGPNLIAVGDWTGRSVPLHCVASGKVLMAALAEREVLRIVRRGLVTFTERTIVELEPLLEELARIRRRGYATAIGEYELGLNAVAAPVHDGAVPLARDALDPVPIAQPADVREGRRDQIDLHAHELRRAGHPGVIDQREGHLALAQRLDQRGGQPGPVAHLHRQPQLGGERGEEGAKPADEPIQRHRRVPRHEGELQQQRPQAVSHPLHDLDERPHLLLASLQHLLVRDRLGDLGRQQEPVRHGRAPAVHRGRGRGSVERGVDFDRAEALRVSGPAASSPR